MARLPLEAIDRLSPDNEDLVSFGIGEQTNRFFRHLYFIHYGLGEPWRDAFPMAFRFSKAPLSLATMRHIADGWDDDA